MNRTEIIKEVKKFGYTSSDTIKAQADLMDYLFNDKPLSAKAKLKWIRLNMLNKKGRIYLSGGGKAPEDSLELMMAGMLWEGLLKRC
jgi:hypothetical protein